MPYNNNGELARIYQLFYQLKIASKYKGYTQTAYAVYLAAQKPKNLSLVTKRLYPEVAKKYHTTWNAVERNIRTILTIIWDNNSELLEKIAGYPLSRKPETKQFISILVSALDKSYPKSEGRQ